MGSVGARRGRWMNDDVPQKVQLTTSRVGSSVTPAPQCGQAALTRRGTGRSEAERAQPSTAFSESDGAAQGEGGCPLVHHAAVGVAADEHGRARCEEEQRPRARHPEQLHAHAQ